MTIDAFSSKQNVRNFQRSRDFSSKFEISKRNLINQKSAAFNMSDPLGGDVFDVESLADAEIEKLLKQVCNKCYTSKLRSILKAIQDIHGIFIFFSLSISARFLPQYRTIEAERLSFIDVKEKTSRKYSKLLKILEKEKSDLQYQLDSEQKGIHARRDSDVYFLSKFKLFSSPQLKSSILFTQEKPLNGLLLLLCTFFSSLF